MRIRGPLVAGLALLLTAAPLSAQNGFLFQRPIASLTLRGGPVMHRAGGDVFDFITTELTLDRDDFRAVAVGGELALAVHDRVDVVFGVSSSMTETSSESREWVGDDDEPIRQVTRFRTVPVTASVRLYPLSRGERISELAWLPARTTPYVGAGGGLAAYRLQQDGEFVDESDLSIFSDSFESKGSGWTAHALAGVDHWFTPRVALNVEARYTRGRADPEGDFRSGPGGEWQSIDLGGFQAGVGLSFRW